MLEPDQPLTGERRDADRPVAGQRVARAHHDRELLARELDPLERVELRGLEDEREVDRAVAQPVDHPLDGPLTQADLDARVARS